MPKHTVTVKDKSAPADAKPFTLDVQGPQRDQAEAEEHVRRTMPYLDVIPKEAADAVGLVG